MSDDDRPKHPPLVVIERDGRARHTPVTLEVLNKKFEDHAKLDQEQLGAIATELTKVREEQATKRDTKSQNLFLSVVVTIATAIGALIHGLLGHG